MEALPWTIGLLFTATILSFIIGNLLGAVAAWPRAPTWLRNFATPFVILQGMPPVLLGVLLLFFVGFRLKLLPLGGAYSIGIQPSRTVAFCAGCAQAPDLAGAGAYFWLGGRMGAVDARHGHYHPGRGLRQLRRT